MITLSTDTIDRSVTGVFVTCSLGGHLSFDWMPLLFVNCTMLLNCTMTCECIDIVYFTLGTGNSWHLVIGSSYGENLWCCTAPYVTIMKLYKWTICTTLQLCVFRVYLPCALMPIENMAGRDGQELVYHLEKLIEHLEVEIDKEVPSSVRFPWFNL